MTTHSGSAQSPNTWGGFIEYATSLGAQIITCTYVDAAGQTVQFEALERKVATSTWTLPLPKNWTSDRRMGTWKVIEASSRLGLKKPDWPAIM
jgi:hypothetical protein